MGTDNKSLRCCGKGKFQDGFTIFWKVNTLVLASLRDCTRRNVTGSRQMQFVARTKQASFLYYRGNLSSHWSKSIVGTATRSTRENS